MNRHVASWLVWYCLSSLCNLYPGQARASPSKTLQKFGTAHKFLTGRDNNYERRHSNNQFAVLTPKGNGRVESAKHTNVKTRTVEAQRLLGLSPLQEGFSPIPNLKHTLQQLIVVFITTTQDLPVTFSCADNIFRQRRV